jgi:hypothetical protein
MTPFDFFFTLQWTQVALVHNNERDMAASKAASPSQRRTSVESRATAPRDTPTTPSVTISAYEMTRVLRDIVMSYSRITSEFSGRERN